MELTVSDAWRSAYPGAVVGILVIRGVANPDRHPALDERKRELESELRARFVGRDVSALKTLEPIPAYTAYYKRFDKTYPVLLQLESVALRGKSLPSGAALVEAMFLAELKGLLLTAGHDLAATQPPVTLDVATGTERYVRINGQEQKLRRDDMMMADAQGVIASVIYGPDQRTRITPDTRDVLFVVYAPPGIGEEAVRRHLEEIRDNALLVAPDAEVEALRVHRAG